MDSAAEGSLGRSGGATPGQQRHPSVDEAYFDVGPFQAEYDEELRALGPPPNDEDECDDVDDREWGSKKAALDAKFSKKLWNWLEQQEAAAAADAATDDMEVDDGMGMEKAPETTEAYYGPFQAEYDAKLRALGPPPSDEDECEDDGYVWVSKKTDLDAEFSKKLWGLLEGQSDGDDDGEEEDVDAMDTGEEDVDEMGSYKSVVDGYLLEKNTVSHSFLCHHVGATHYFGSRTEHISMTIRLVYRTARPFVTHP